MSNKVQKYSKFAVGKLAKVVATRDANTTCPLLGYQPKLPDAVKKLKK